MHHVHALLGDRSRVGAHGEVQLQMRENEENDNYTVKRNEKTYSADHLAEQEQRTDSVRPGS